MQANTRPCLEVLPVLWQDSHRDVSVLGIRGRGRRAVYEPDPPESGAFVFSWFLQMIQGYWQSLPTQPSRYLFLLPDPLYPLILACLSLLY